MENKGLWINAEIMGDTRLNMTEKFVLAEIQNLSQVGEVWATNKHFATVGNIHEKHVSRVIRKLVDLELITMQIIYKADSKEIEKRILTPQQNVTTPPQDVTTLVTNCYDPSNISDPTPSNNMLPINNKSLKNKSNNKLNNLYISEFEQLWAMYPNKKGKPQAQQAYIRARKENVEYETIKIGLESYIKYVQIQHTEKRFIKHGSTWFNQKAWQDEYDLRPKGYLGLLYDMNTFEQGDDLFGQNRGSENFSDFTKHIPEPIPQYGGHDIIEPKRPNVGRVF